jgi:imidazolonepropionase-like amidohydrolase
MYLLKVNQALTGGLNEVITNCAVLVDGERIIEIGKEKDIEVPTDAKILQFNEYCTILPGLIDCHVHLAFDASSDPIGNMYKSSNQELLKRMENNAKVLLDSGVTTARDMGACGFFDIKIRDAIEKGFIAGPNLMVSTRPLTTTGGHCWFMGGECDDIASISEKARENIKGGANWLKIMASGGMMTKGSAAWISQYDVSKIRAAVLEAHRVGKKIASHAHSKLAIQNSVEAGVDTIEHCSWITREGYQFDRATAEIMISKNIMVCSTTSFAWKRGKARMEERYKNAVRMRELGAKFIAGTDAGISNVPFDAYVDGLEVLSELGFTNSQVIESATSLAAAGCGIEDKTGLLAKGKSADIIAVKGNPIVNLDALRQIVMVMKSGTVVIDRTNMIDSVALY